MSEVLKRHLSWYVKGASGRDTDGNISLVQGQAYYVTSRLLCLCFLVRKNLCPGVKTMKERNDVNSWWPSISLCFTIALMINCHFVLCPCSGFPGWSLESTPLLSLTLWYYNWCAPPKAPRIWTGVDMFVVVWHAFGNAVLEPANGPLRETEAHYNSSLGLCWACVLN